MSRLTRSGRLMLVSSIVGADGGIIRPELYQHASPPEIFEGPFHFFRIAGDLLSDRHRRGRAKQANRIPGADFILRYRAGQCEAISRFENDGEAVPLEDGFDRDPVIVADAAE